MPLSDSEWTDSNFVAGDLCLDFSNTLSGRRQSRLKDRLVDYDALLDWLRAAQLLDKAERAALGRRAEAEGRGAARALRGAVGLRECIFTVFDAVSRGEKPDQSAIEALNRRYGKTVALREIEAIGPDYRWRWIAAADPLQRALGGITLSAAALLTTERRRLVRKCRAESCAWLFLDESRNHSRIWCDMAVCGNRAKARRHSLTR